MEHLTLVQRVKERMMASIATLFGRHSTAAEVVAGITLSGKQAIVAGAASGIGIETARSLARTGAEERQKTPEQRATTSVLLATSPPLEGIGGRYFEDCNEATIVTNGNGYISGVAPYALDPDNADRL